MEENNPYAFTSEDIVVWNGIICKYGSIEHLTNKNDNIRKANEEEAKEYTKMKHIKTQQELNIPDVISSFDDFDEQNYEIAKIIFQKEEGREPNMNDVKDMNLVATLEVGVRYTRNYYKK